MLKIVAGIAQERSRRKLAEVGANRQDAVAFQRAVFQGSRTAKSSAFTRRILAIMLVSMICFMGAYGIVYPEKQFTTFLLPEMKQGFTFFWGLVKLPATKETTVILTTGYLALTALNIGALAVGFYFTPFGQK